ncbi:uncharacterized protein F4822DRAFT_398780 [Hypoxylon trugodes]|uniref:uncharacterized protein n=1 Tax=Hypoxylon trugodes TaxID=326681 RepID=UPI00218F37F1|nr:uncharacterized protein F4822DRAFT_398780 [Hypoxylon trugodes]KAI1389547.1 hypothetical protein F4822DRAFT_398780 [Hypoxylon trugodes]
MASPFVVWRVTLVCRRCQGMLRGRISGPFKWSVVGIFNSFPSHLQATNICVQSARTRTQTVAYDRHSDASTPKRAMRGEYELGRPVVRVGRCVPVLVIGDGDVKARRPCRTSDMAGK